MYKVSNTHAITRKQRFQRACLYAIPASILIGIAFGYLNRFLPLQFEILFIGVGYLIGEIIKEFGRGVQIQFSILAVVLTLLAFLIADVCESFGLWAFLHPENILFVLRYNTLGSLFGILFRLAGCYFAFIRARVV